MSAQPILTYLIDAFTDGPFSGNPAGVCFVDAPADPVWMQAVAMEMNQAETAFLSERPDDDWDLRWFTPTVEVDLCGHATLASAKALWYSGCIDDGEPIRFHTRSGVLTCTAEGSRIAMDFPAEPPTAIEAALGLDLKPVYVGRNRMDTIVAVGFADELRRWVPDFGKIAALGGRGLIVTAPSDRPGIDFVSRFFAPQSGVPEDPVTGSAHCCLGPYWRAILGKDNLAAEQASRRGGIVHVHCRGDRVTLSGEAVVVLMGCLSAAVQNAKVAG